MDCGGWRAACAYGQTSRFQELNTTTIDERTPLMIRRLLLVCIVAALPLSAFAADEQGRYIVVF
jgi:hypothetical protein